MRPFLALITPIGNSAVDPGYGRPDWGPVDPGYGNRPPVDPGYGRPGWSPVDPGYGRPGWSPVDPGYGVGGGFRPDNSLPGGGAYPSHPIYYPEGGGDASTKPPGAENLPPIIVWIPGMGWIRVLPGVPARPTPAPDPMPEPK